MIATPRAEIDRLLEELGPGAQRWAALTPREKLALLKALLASVAEASEAWADAAARAKGVDGTPLAGEEWVSGPWAVLYALNRYAATLQEIADTGAPRIAPSRVHTRPDGQVVVGVFPDGIYDRVLLNGIRAEVWMQPGVTAATLPETTGVWYRETQDRPRLALVLGAGNIASIAPLDVIYKLYAEGAVCILKLNPVNDYLGPILEQALAPLVEAGYLRFAYGGADVGRDLCNHPLIDDIHITGSDRTHDAIVFGTGPDATQRKREGRALLQKPISSELGNVSPTIVAAGPWSDADLRYQAENIVTQKLHNNGFNCIAAQVLVLPAEWDATPKLIAAIERVLTTAIDRPAYYPGAHERSDALRSGRAQMHSSGSQVGEFTARSLIHVDSQQARDPLFQTEAFSSVLAYTTLPGDVDTYLAHATAFANDVLWGTLGANLIAHPSTMRKHRDAFDAAIAGLRYGCVAINAWTGVGFLLAETTWGAFPGGTIGNVGSGIGVVHNSHFFSRAQKSVVYAPFAPFPRSLLGYGGAILPKPPWFVTNRQGAKIGQALCAFEAAPSPLKAVKIALLALQG